MFEIGRICVKTKGRDAGQYCTIVDILDDKTVLIDGNTRRRKCNITHLEPLDKTVEIKKNATNKEVAAALSKAGIECKERKPSAKAQKKAEKEKPVAK